MASVFLDHLPGRRPDNTIQPFIPQPGLCQRNLHPVPDWRSACEACHQEVKAAFDDMLRSRGITPLAPAAKGRTPRSEGNKCSVALGELGEPPDPEDDISVEDYRLRVLAQSRKAAA